MAPRCDNKATQNPTVLGVRPHSYPATRNHRSARARNTTLCQHCVFMFLRSLEINLLFLTIPLTDLSFWIQTR
jgi:hypothetical protein